MWMLAGILSLLFLTGCSKFESKPTEADSRKLVDEFRAQWPHKDTTVAFEILDGLAAEKHGVKLYCVEYAAESVLSSGPQKGQRSKFYGTLSFTKTEKGWQGKIWGMDNKRSSTTRCTGTIAEM